MKKPLVGKEQITTIYKITNNIKLNGIKWKDFNINIPMDKP
ncbi:hypothetical protein N752_30330 [Desulforamulus aquiferis]|nr:hypothetical protein N752_30330 [Desulforamulus aquiferis]